MTAAPRTMDVHQHLLPPGFLEVLRRRAAPPRIVGGELELAEGRFAFDLAEHDLEARIDALDRQGTDVGVLSLQQTFGHDDLPQDERAELVSAWEEGIAQVVTEAGGRLAALAAGPTQTGLRRIVRGLGCARRPRRARDGDRVGASPRRVPVRSSVRRRRAQRRTRLVGRPRGLHGADAGRVPRLAGTRPGSAGRTSRSSSRSSPVEARSSSSGSARAASTSGLSSIRTSTSTRRPTAGARSSSASRRSASSRSSTAATCPSSIRNPHFGR